MVELTGPGVSELFSAVGVLKVSRWQGHHKVLNLSLTRTPNGGRCLPIYVPVEGQRDHLGHFGDKT